MTGIGGGYKIESSAARTLRSINTESYDYRNQAKVITKLTSDVSYLAQYTRQMQKGIDSANENFIQQIGDFINEILVVLGGGGNTGFDLGDLKYIIQAIGALFGFDEATGIASIFPINLFSAAWHFISTYILPVDNFGELIDFLIDQFLATLLDLFGEIPILGQAIQQFAVFISQIRDVVNGLFELIGSWTAPFVEFLVNTVNWVYETFFSWTEPIATWVVNTVGWLFNLFGSWTAELVTFIVDGITWLVDLFTGWTAPFVTWLTNSLNALMTVFGDWSLTIANWVRDTLTWLYNLFVDWTAPFVTWLTSTVSFLGTLFSEWTAPFVTLVNQVVAAVQEIVDWFTGVANSAFSFLFPWAKKLPQMEIVGGQEVVKQSNVPGLDAGKITTGTFGDTQIPSLSTSKITTGTFGSSFIADSAITTGKIADLAVTGGKTSSLDAAKVTTGTFGTTQIPSLDTGKITTGTFGTTFISDSAITNAKISDLAVTGVKTSGLDASKINTGSLSGGLISNGTVTGTKIAGSTITGSNIASSTVGGGNIAANTIATGNIADNAVTGGKTSGLDAGKITSGTISAGLLPAGIGAVGSGIFLQGSGTGGITTNGGVNRFLTSHYTSPVGTADFTVSSDPTYNWIIVTATNAGWYLAEISYGINQSTKSYSWNTMPILFKGNTSFKRGHSITYLANQTYYPLQAHSSFIIYLNAGDTIAPGAYTIGTPGQTTYGIVYRGAVTEDFYFAVSLLNRSLA